MNYNNIKIEKITIEGLLKAGAHLGHKSSLWNPKMKDFIYCRRNKLHIIDLEKTVKMFQMALQYIGRLILGGEQVLFVCTNQHFRAVISDELEKIRMPFISRRWLGGTLTNFSTVNCTPPENEGAVIMPTGAPVVRQNTDRVRMRRMPGALFVIGVEKHKIAINEAKKVGVPVIALVDSNNCPSNITIPVPSNDDSVQVVHLYIKSIVNYVVMMKDHGH